MQRLVVFFLILVCRALPLAAMETGGEGVVREIVDGDTLFLDDGRQVRLVGIQAPKLPLGRRGFKAWPLAGESKKALAGIALGKPVALSFGGAHRDRHGRLLAHLYLKDGLWIQGEMIEKPHTKEFKMVCLQLILNTKVFIKKLSVKFIRE